MGSGGREHALAWALARSAGPVELHAAPGNPGIAALAHCHPVRADDPASIVPLACELGVDLVVVGPEAPLVIGLADMLRRRGVAVFGPGAEAARIEGSKAFAKDVMDAAGVPTAQTLAVARPPCVVKADGLAAGKGVWVCRTQAELDAGLRAAEALGQPFHVEELLVGEEVSVFSLSDGRNSVPLPGRAGLQAHRRRRRGRQHRRHGLVLARAEADRRRGGGAGRDRPRARRRRAGPARRAVRRRPLRRLHAHRRRAARARVQLPFRRPGDAVAAAAARRRPAPRARRGRARRPLRRRAGRRPTRRR